MSVIDMGGDSLIVQNIVTGQTTPGIGQGLADSAVNTVGMNLGGVLFARQSTNYVLTTAGTAGTAVQPVLNVSTAGAVSLSGNQTYMFEGEYMITNTNSTSHTWSLAFGGNATLSNIAYQVYTTDANTAGSVTASSITLHVTTAGATVVSAANTAATESVDIFVTGIVSVTAGGAGTFIPQIKLSATGGTATVLTGTYFGLWPVGNATATVVGTWS